MTDTTTTPNLLIVPDWLTKEFLENLLENDQDTPDCTAEIVLYNINIGLPKGNNYMSDILRINIDYKIHFPPNSGTTKIPSQHISLITKIPLKKEIFPDSVGIFKKEFCAYNVLLPKLHTMLRGYKDEDLLSPKVFKCNLEYIIMEDLVPKGYTMADKTKQLDYNHGVLVMKKLAKFHAATVKLYETDQKLVENCGSNKFVKREIKQKDTKTDDPVFGEIQLGIVIEEFEKWPETKKFVSFLKKLKPKLRVIFDEAIKYKDGEFAVLNHGDLWTNNVLFSYDKSGKPNDLIFIDFQIMKYTTPIYDILNFLYTSMRFEHLAPNFHALTQTYLEYLNCYLEKYECSKRLKDEDFRKSLEKREIFGLLRSIKILPFTLSGCEEEESKTETYDGNPALTFIRTEAFRRLCTKHLEYFSKKAWFKNFE